MAVQQSNIKSNQSGWLNELAATKAIYRVVLWISLFSIVSFSILLVKWVLASTDIDNSGMGLIVLIPPVGMCLLLMLMSGLALFYNMKRGIKISRGIFIVMIFLSIPTLLFGIACLWVLAHW